MSLVISPPADLLRPHFVWTGIVALPVMVESTGIILGAKQDYRVWINQPRKGITRQFRVSQLQDIEELGRLLFVAAAAASAEESLFSPAPIQAGRR